MSIDWKQSYDEMTAIAQDWKEVAARERHVRESIEALHVAVVMPKLGGGYGATENRCKSCTSEKFPCATKRAILRAQA